MGKAWDGKAIEEAASRPRDLGGVERLTGDPDHPEGRKMTARTGSAFANRAGEAGAYDFSVTGNRAFQAWVHEWGTEAFRVLKPGGHALVFGGTRTYHRLASGLEDAGFEIRDTLAWMFGQGFPKSLDVGRAIDNVQGTDGAWRAEDHPGRSGARDASVLAKEGSLRIGQLNHRSDDNPEGLRHVYEPGSPEGQAWDGWGTALKPAFEPIVLARKPIPTTVARNVLEHGTGALNIDGCRIEFQGDDDEAESKEKNRHADFGSGPRENAVYGADERARGEHGNYDPPGRWPANVLLGHSPECVPVGVREVASDGHYPAARPNSSIGETQFGGFEGQDDLDERSTRGEQVEVWECVPDCPVRLLDEQTGERGGGYATRGESQDGHVFGFGNDRGDEPRGYGDSGGASRFFYCAKVSRAERSAGLDAFAARDLNWSSGDANPGSFQSEGTERAARNHHPTVKPIALMRWLIRLVTPPGGLVVDPFMGSGSTGCAAALEGMRFLGIERETDYALIAEARIRFWVEHGEETLDVVARHAAADRVRDAIAETGQLDLLGGVT